MGLLKASLTMMKELLRSKSIDSILINLTKINFSGVHVVILRVSCCSFKDLLRPTNNDLRDVIKLN